ncbi:MAG TPA: OmpA family protein [Vicinamibacterales bacterium]|nr:OmpA family protein [Vicinamibacterales bacterium]
MSSRRTTGFLVPALALALCVSACASKPRAVVVLLPDDHAGTVGGAIVENASGSVKLSAARESTRVGAQERPSAATTMTDAEVQRMFGDALAALPPPPRTFVLNFRFQSDQLTGEARVLVAHIVKVVRERPSATVVVTGHTDTMGSARANHALGLKRATTVRKLLIAAGLDASRIEVSSLGETDPLVRTADEKAEPRNRRVDVTVR